MSVKLRPHPSGGWRVDVSVRLASGVWYRERPRKQTSKSAAHRWGEERERHLLVHGLPVKKKEVPTVDEFAPRFIENFARAERQKPSTIAQKQIVLRVHLLPLLGRRRLDALTNEDVQRLKQQLGDKSTKTLNNVLSVLSKLLKVAVEWDVIDHVPCKVRTVKLPEPLPPFWRFDQFEKLIDAAASLDSRAKLVVLLGGEAGLRAGEIRALEWRDIDFSRNRIKIERSEWHGQITTPKSNRSRAVPMTARLQAALQQHRQLPGRRVVCESTGEPLTEAALSSLVERTARLAGLVSGRKPKGAGPHVLRHTFCSHLAMRRASPRAIQQLAGHSKLTTTERYMHLTEEALDETIRLLNPAAGGTGVAQETEAIEKACG